jgi:hypothetical protein
VQPSAEPAALRPGSPWRRWTRTRWWSRGLWFALALATVTIGRAAVECRSQLQRGTAAERAGDSDGARLRWGEARLWRIPIFTAAWADEATRRLRALPAGSRTGLAGALIDDPTSKTMIAAQFGRPPSGPLSFLGGLALVVGLLAAAGWARTARSWCAGITVVGGIVAAIALWAA